MQRDDKLANRDKTVYNLEHQGLTKAKYEYFAKNSYKTPSTCCPRVPVMPDDSRIVTLERQCIGICEIACKSGQDVLLSDLWRLRGRSHLQYMLIRALIDAKLTSLDHDDNLRLPDLV